MFANEQFVKASPVMVLEGTQIKQSNWKQKEVILTERSLFFFDKNEDITTATPLQMKLITTNAIYKGLNPPYKSKLPVCEGNYTYFIELKILKRRRIITMHSKQKAKEWVRSICLYHSYLLTEEYCLKSHRILPNFITKWVEDYEVHQGKFEIHLNMATDETFQILQEFLKNNRSVKCICIPNILLNKEKLDKILNSTETRIIEESPRKKADSDSDNEDNNILLKNIKIKNSKNLNLNVLFDIPKDQPISSLGKDPKIKSLKILRSLVNNYMDSGNHTVKFLYETLPNNFEVPPDDSMIGTIKKMEKTAKRKNIDDIFDGIYKLYKNQKDNFIEEIEVLVDEMVEYCNFKAEGQEHEQTTVLEKFGREKLSPLMMLINDQLRNAIDNNHLYSLEILCNSTKKLGFQNTKESEQKLCQLRNEAEFVTSNLIQVLNMTSEQEHELNDLLDICLSKARNIGMRGELIDVCNAIKTFRDKMTNELIDTK